MVDIGKDTRKKRSLTTIDGTLNECAHQENQYRSVFLEAEMRTGEIAQQLRIQFSAPTSGRPLQPPATPAPDNQCCPLAFVLTPHMHTK